MKIKISKKNKRNIKRSKNNRLSGGKPLFRNINQMQNTIAQSMHDAFTAPNGTNNIRQFSLVSDTSYFGYFYKIDIGNNDTYLNINVNNAPVHSGVRQLGYKVTVVSPNFRERWRAPGGNEKSTVTVREFREECSGQYSVFSATCMDGANSITPGIVACAIYTNVNSIAILNSMIHRSANPRTTATAQQLLWFLTSNNTVRIGLILMEFVPHSITISTAIDQSVGIPLRVTFLANMMRWALLRSAFTTQLLHADFHLENALYSRYPANTGYPGFYHDIDRAGRLIPIDESIQIIDWGQVERDAQISADITQLFAGMHAHIRAHPDEFVNDVMTAMHLANTMSVNVYLQFNTRILNIFTRWLQVARRAGNQYFTWVTRAFGIAQADGIYSFAICYHEARYMRNRNIVLANPHIYNSIVHAPDPAIMNAIAQIV